MFLYRFVWFLLISSVAAQNVEWESTCVTDPSGVPRLHLENHSSKPMVFGLQCNDNSFQIYVLPHTTNTINVYFPWDVTSPEDQCLLLDFVEFPNNFFLTVYPYILDEDLQSNKFNYTWCDTSPGIVDDILVYSDCAPFSDGFVEYHFVNNLQEAINAEFTCSDVTWSDVTFSTADQNFGVSIPAKSRAVVRLKHYSPFRNYQNPENCVLVADSSEFYQFKAVTSTQTPGYFWKGVLHCRGGVNAEPITEIIPHCPSTPDGNTRLELRADVPAYAVVHCRNGDAQLSAVKGGSASLDATFYQGSDPSDCQFYKQEDVHTYSVVVEVGWGFRGRELFLDSEVQTISCVYGNMGKSRTSVERVEGSIFPPQIFTHHLGELLQGVFQIVIVDVLDRKISSTGLENGRFIRLMATENSGAVHGFRAYSCVAHNGVTSYAILRNGCGDGLILDADAGFVTTGNVVYSPYFEVFCLRGGRNLWFDCTFSACAEDCDGSSCSFVEPLDQDDPDDPER